MQNEVKSSKKLMSSTYQSKSSKSKKIVPKSAVIKSKRPASKGPIKIEERSIKGEPGGYHMNKNSKYQTMELPNSSKGIIKKKSEINDYEYGSENKPMQQDFEGQRYLEYKSISGMDLIPRIRQPTPEKKEEETMIPTDCEGCLRY